MWAHHAASLSERTPLQNRDLNPKDYNSNNSEGELLNTRAFKISPYTIILVILTTEAFIRGYLIMVSIRNHYQEVPSRCPF